MSIVALSLLLLVYFLVMIFTVVLYILPVIIAYKRKHNNFMGILLLTTFAAWTIVFWVIALIWSLSSNTTNTLTSQLNELEDLKNKGIINQAEYNSKKRALLGQ
jgi:hypothetical protein